MILEPLFKEVEKQQELHALNIMAYSNIVWCYTDNELCINTDGDKNALFEGDGNTYSYFARYITESDDSYVMFYDADNGCGTHDTIIVKAVDRRE